MGIKHLEYFIKHNVPNGYNQVSLKEECENYKRANGRKPVLVIDLMGLANWLAYDYCELLCGGNFDNYKSDLEIVFTKLSAISEIVFYEDGPVMAEKSETWIERQNARYVRCCNIMDDVYKETPLKEIVEKHFDIPINTSNIPVIEALAKQFGKLVVTVTKECDAELVHYANENSVMGIIANDSDFLIFSGNWRYFSLKDLDKDSLKTFEFDKKNFENYIELDSSQLRVFATIAGNDVLRYDQVKDFLDKKCGKGANQKFKTIAEIVKRDFKMTGEALVEAIAKKVLKTSGDRLKANIRDSLAQYDMNFEVPDFSVIDPLLHYCQVEHLNFSFAILRGFLRNMTLAYYDLREKGFPDVYEVTAEIHRKQCGILLQHKKGKKRNRLEIFTKKTHDEGYQSYMEVPWYPRDELPPLLELLNREQFPEHDEIRFKLLIWLIDERKLKDFDLAVIPRNYFLDVLTLTWLCRCGFITITEADLILLTIKRVETGNKPENLQPPEILNKRAFQIAFIFTKFYVNINRCLQVTGLKKSLTKILNFNSVIFQKMYNNMIAKDFSPKTGLVDLNHIRIYA